jgi:hypothetical protein
MNKFIVTGALASALIAFGGTGLYMASAKENPKSPEAFMEEQGIDFGEMNEMMANGDFDEMQQYMDDQNMNFGQMKPYMKEMHPDLGDQDLEQMYKGMHGTGGSGKSANFKGMGSF